MEEIFSMIVDITADLDSGDRSDDMVEDQVTTATGVHCVRLH
jgi:hypothetical protein